MMAHAHKTDFVFRRKRTSPSAGASVQSPTGSRGVRISGSNAEYTMFRGSVKGTGYPLHSPVSPSLPLPCVTVCHHISTGIYSSILSSTSALYGGSTPRPGRFIPGKETWYPLYRSWVCPRNHLDGLEKSRPTGIRSLDRPTRS